MCCRVLGKGCCSQCGDLEIFPPTILDKINILFHFFLSVFPSLSCVSLCCDNNNNSNNNNNNDNNDNNDNNNNNNNKKKKKKKNNKDKQ